MDNPSQSNLHSFDQHSQLAEAVPHLEVATTLRLAEDTHLDEEAYPLLVEAITTHLPLLVAVLVAGLRLEI
jgi:hypothetical protein